LSWSPWYDYNTEAVNKNASPNIGVYEVGDSLKNTVYYGEGGIKERLLYHLDKKELPLGRYFRFEVTNSKERAVQRQNALLEDYKKIYKKYPMYNERKG